MKFRTAVILCAILACVSISRAEVVCNVWDDGDHVLTCTNVSWVEDTGNSEYDMGIAGTHNLWGYGHIVGTITSDGDPTIKVTNSIDNDTGSSWTDYHLNIYMSQPFTIVANSAFVTTPSDWNPNSVITPVAWNGLQYEGSIDYYSGTTVPDTGTLEFGYKINFTTIGTINYTQEMIPTPEPSALVILACGLVGLFIFKKRA